jgi:hypothetical protein
MRLKPVVFACFLVLTANPLTPGWAIAQPTPRPTQPSRCKALSDLSLPPAPELGSFIDTPAVQQASKQVNILAKLSAHYATAGLNAKADELAAQAIHRLEQAGGKRDYALSRLFFAYLDLKLYDRAFALFDQQLDDWKTSNLLYVEQDSNLPTVELQANNDPPEPAQLAFLARLARSLPASSWAKVGLLTKIAAFYRSPEQTQQRLTFTREALQAAQAAQDSLKFYEPYYRLAEIADLYNSVGDKKQAAQLLAQAVAAISTDQT